MTFQDYVRETEENVRTALKDYQISSLSDLWNVYDELWIDDSVTGNGSGSYTFNSYKAEENVKDLFFDEDFLDGLKEFGVELGELLNDGPEALDVTARCVALGRVDIDKLCKEELARRREELANVHAQAKMKHKEHRERSEVR